MSKEKVVQKYPSAAVEYSYVQKEYVVYHPVGRNRHILGVGPDPQAAWKCAAARISN